MWARASQGQGINAGDGMSSEFEEPPRGGGGWQRVSSSAGVGALRCALLFGSVAIALALLLVPVLERRTSQVAGTGIGLDQMATGSVGGKSRTYTIRRSVFQPSRDAVCIIAEDGSRHGRC